MKQQVVSGFLTLLLTGCSSSGSSDCTTTGTCPNQSPNATIASPAPSAMVNEFVAVSFQGSATDAEDGALSGTALVWTSNVDGALGTGTSFSRSDLSAGAHVVTLAATDSDGATGTATVAITIVDVPNQPPGVTISLPADGASALTGDNVTFSGTANDAEDGSITGAALVWTSDLDGTIGTGNTFTRNDLSGGTHQIALTATDDDGAFGADTISLSIGGAPAIAITGPANQAGGAPHTVTVGTSITFTGSGSDAEDGPLTGASLVWESNVDGPIGTGETFSLSSLNAGLHTITLTATDSEANESKETVLVIVKPPTALGFQIHIRQSEGVTLTASQSAAIDAAVTKLQAVITGDVSDLATSAFPDVGTCAGAAIPPMNESVDDVIIYLEFVPIDGAGNVLGSAGPCFVRTGTAQSLVGGMRFDTDDLAMIETFGLLDDILLHEMMHVLGFGVFWNAPVDYLEQPSTTTAAGYTPGMTDTHFTGPASIARFDSLGGGSYTGGNVVPVENDTTTYGPGSLDGHWRESVFDDEIMTPSANLPSNSLSELTIAQFEDLGYTVDYGAADAYSQVFTIVLGSGTPAAALAGKVDLSHDTWRGEIHAVEPDGRTRRIR